MWCVSCAFSERYTEFIFWKHFNFYFEQQVPSNKHTPNWIHSTSLKQLFPIGVPGRLLPSMMAYTGRLSLHRRQKPETLVMSVWEKAPKNAIVIQTRCGGRCQIKNFSALRASVWSTNKGEGDGDPGPLPCIRHWNKHDADRSIKQDVDRIKITE